MARNREEIQVGAVVVIAAVLFLTALVFVGGVNLLRKRKVTYTTYFKFAGGLEPGSFVRFGGLKVGTVESASIDSSDSTRIKVVLQVADGTPVRANSKARISSLGFLGENYVEVSPGTRDHPLLPPGSEVPALEIVQLADVFNNVNNVTVNADKLVTDLNDRVIAVADNANRLIDNLNATISPENRQHLTRALANADAMLDENRQHIKQTLGNLAAVSNKLGPTLEKTDATISRAHVLVGNMNGLVEENRKEIHEALVQLRSSLRDAQKLMLEVSDTLEMNRANLDEALENIRISSENLKQFTNTIKQRPFSLVRIKTQKDRIPPTGK
jgi:phospholipid/cholesterol/gamma-HCH transport system substrate-binding protein